MSERFRDFLIGLGISAVLVFAVSVFMFGLWLAQRV